MGRACVQGRGARPGPRRHRPGAQLCGWFARLRPTPQGTEAPGPPLLIPVAISPTPRFPTSRAAPGLLGQGLLPESGRLVVCCPGRLLALNAVLLSFPTEGRQGPPRPIRLRAAV